MKAVRQIVERGGRVLATGTGVGRFCRADASDTTEVFNFAACKLEPEGLDRAGGFGRGMDGAAR